MKKYAWIGLISLAAALTVATVVTINNRFTPLESETEGYTLTLNTTNCGFVPSSRSTGQSTTSNSPVTSKGNPILFSYTSAMKPSGFAMNLSANTGTIANITPLTGLFSIVVNYSGGECQLSYGNAYSSYTGSLNIQSGVRYEMNYGRIHRMICSS